MSASSKDRLSSPIKERAGITILDIDTYAPFLLNAVSNGWQRITSGTYRRAFDLGIVDWRVMAMLNIEPEITANRVCEVIRLDKAAVSRSLKLMHERGLVAFEASRTDTRKRRWWLSDKGQEAHRDILKIALENEARLVADVTPEELETFLKVMRVMMRNLDGMDQAGQDRAS